MVDVLRAPADVPLADRSIDRSTLNDPAILADNGEQAAPDEPGVNGGTNVSI